jgi:hypothetical protein
MKYNKITDAPLTTMYLYILASLLGKHTQIILKVNTQTRGSKPYSS